MPRIRAALCLSLFLLASCGADWHRVEPAPESALSSGTQYLVYHGGAIERWHAVRVTADSVSGIAWLHPVECDSCRQVLPRVAVDSLQEGHPVAGVWKTVALVVWGPPLFLSLLCILHGEGGGCWVPPST